MARFLRVFVGLLRASADHGRRRAFLLTRTRPPPQPANGAAETDDAERTCEATPGDLPGGVGLRWGVRGGDVGAGEENSGGQAENLVGKNGRLAGGDRVFGAICGSDTVSGREKQREERMMETRCRHCGSSMTGHGCPYGPNGLHEHRADEDHCDWCGSSMYGHGCPYGPGGIHRHGIGSKCIWCGSTMTGMGCPYSPTKRHER